MFSTNDKEQLSLKVTGWNFIVLKKKKKTTHDTTRCAL